MLKRSNGQCYFTVEELHDLASHIAMNIYDKHPDISQRSESKRLVDEIALNTVNELIKDDEDNGAN